MRKRGDGRGGQDEQDEDQHDADDLGEEDDGTMEFKSLLRGRILEILNAWPAKDQYAIMFLIYPNEAHTYRGYSNLTEFQMLYKCESDMGKHTNPFFAPADEDEECWIYTAGQEVTYSSYENDFTGILGLQDRGVRSVYIRLDKNTFMESDLSENEVMEKIRKAKGK